MNPLPAVDCHAHVFSASAAPAAGARYRPAYAARLDAWRAHWPANGVVRGVLVQPSFFGDDNHEMLAAIGTDREHLRGVAVVAPTADDELLARLASQGVRGVRLNLKGVADESPFAGGAWKALYGRLARHGLHLEAFVDTGRLPHVAAALERLDVPVVLDHFGNPGTEGAEVDASFAAAQRLAASIRLYVKLSGPYRLGGADRRALAQRWLALLGPERLVWGSDWPWTNHEPRGDYRRLREDLGRWLDPALAPRILWDNAARLYGFD